MMLYRFQRRPSSLCSLLACLASLATILLTAHELSRR